MLSALDRKLLRDLRRIWAQALAIALVMACGVSVIILAVGAYRSLEETRSAFYERNRFGDIFATANRAPGLLRAQIELIPGVSFVETRIRQSAILDIPGMTEPARADILSLPDHRAAGVNQLHIRAGRLPEIGRRDEVAVLESFTEANKLELGDTIAAILNGKRRNLKIVGIVLSPEFIYTIGPGELVPDPRRFGVLYVKQSDLAALFDMEGAFNDLAVKTNPEADNRVIIAELDKLMRPYGGTGAYARKDQQSHAFLDAELTQLRGMTFVIPPIFLLVAAFLLNMILSRLIDLEREQIGLLKALGYGNGAIGGHYAKLVIAIALIGVLIGSGFGWWMGRGLTRIYSDFYTFPFLIFRQSPDLYLIASCVTVGAALAGAAKSIWSTVRLDPAVAMRPPAPMRYRAVLPESWQKYQLFSRLTIMALRHLIRRPFRAATTAFGISMSVALLITTLFSFDAIDDLIDTLFFQLERQDATIYFAQNQSRTALIDAARLPGVLAVEGFRGTAVALRSGHREVRTSIAANTEGATLSRVLDHSGAPIRMPTSGIVLSDRVADRLQVSIGDSIQVKLYEKDDRLENLTLVGIADTPIGIPAYMSLAGLNRLLREGPKISGVHLDIDLTQVDALYAAAKETPMISAISLLTLTREKFQETVSENIGISATIYVVLAVIITFGVVYNSARIQLSERARELASLRVFGFTKAEVSSVLMLELGIMVLIAQPLGWLFGVSLAWLVVQGFASDLFRFPLVLETATFANASLVVVSAAVVSALIVRRRIDRLDMIRVLKTRE